MFSFPVRLCNTIEQNFLVSTSTTFQQTFSKCSPSSPWTLKPHYPQTISLSRDQLALTVDQPSLHWLPYWRPTIKSSFHSHTAQPASHSCLQQHDRHPERHQLHHTEISFIWPSWYPPLQPCLSWGHLTSNSWDTCPHFQPKWPAIETKVNLITVQFLAMMVCPLMCCCTCILPLNLSLHSQ